MSTPSASGGSKPPPGAQNAATPQSHSHLNTFSSPAPRSVPSPATHRNQAGKSPFNTTAQNHPTTGSTTSGPSKLLEASPGTNMGSFDSPAGLGPSLSSMGINNIGFGDGAFNMGFNPSGMSGLNAGSSLSGRLDDQERRRRLEYIVARLRKVHPRLSPEGVEIVGQRLDMDCLVDPPQGLRKDGTRTVTLAGDRIAVEVMFKADFNVSAVEVSSPEASEMVAKHFESASQVLLHDLTEPPMMPLLRRLGRFHENLNRLARLDKLNAQPGSQGFNCFEALTGVYNSLRRLFEHEKKTALALIEEKYDWKIARSEREVMCRKSGRPMMNGRNVVGLSLDYWMQKWRRFPKQSADPAFTSDVQRLATEPHPAIQDQKVFSLLIECEEFAHELYPPVRISNSWISDAVEKSLLDPNDIFGPSATLDWLDPPPTFISGPMNTDSDAMTLDVTANKLPNIRFIAKLNPPLVLPDHVASGILATVGVQQEAAPEPYHNLLLKIPLVDQMELLGKEKTTENIRVSEGRNAEMKTYPVRHRNLLTMKNTLYARTLEEIPFSHPKQLVDILPLLRQWACINSLLTQSFASKPPLDPQDDLPISIIDVNFDVSFARFDIRFPLREPVLANPENADMKLSDLVSRAYDTSEASAVPTSVEIILDVGPSGEITILDHQIAGGSGLDFLIGKYRPAALADKQGEELQKELRRLVAKDLEIGADFDTWVEWIKHIISLPKTTT